MTNFCTILIFLYTDATCSTRIRPGKTRAGSQAADGRAVDQSHGRAPRRGQPARQLLRQEVYMVRFNIEQVPSANSAML